jgi:hypothetical protein
MRRMIALILISICMAGAAAGCSGGASGGGHGGAQGGGSQGGSSQGGGTEQTMAVMRQLAHCIRSHGMPGWPDPIINPLTSAPDWPQSAPRLPAGIQQACQSIANLLPPAAQQSQPPTPASMQALVRFARCLRSHGIPTWPDPNALGEFPMTTQMAAQFKGTDRPAVGACIHYVPGGSQYLRFVGAAQQPGSAGNG